MPRSVSMYSIGRKRKTYVPLKLVTPTRGRSRIRNRTLDQLYGVELKFVDYNYTATIVNTTAGAEADPGTALCLNAIAQGDGESQRDGRKAVIKSFEIRGFVNFTAQSDAADPAGGQIVRLVLVQDRQTNAAQENSEDVLSDSAGNDVNSMTNLQFEKRFRILRDVRISVEPAVAFTDGTNTGAVSGTTKSFHWKGRLNMPVNYSGTTAVIGSIVDNSLHIIAIASGGTAANLTYTSRVRFVG